jgi:toxin CptA
MATLPWLALVAFLIVAALADNVWMLAAIPVALTGALLQYRNNGLLKGCRCVKDLSVEQDQLYARTGDNLRVPVDAMPASRVWSGLALLKLRPADTRYRTYTTILLTSSLDRPGNVAEEEFRRLRMWLRLGRSKPPST